jgi:hypothetical protein
MMSSSPAPALKGRAKLISPLRGGRTAFGQLPSAICHLPSALDNAAGVKYNPATVDAL